MLLLQNNVFTYPPMTHNTAQTTRENSIGWMIQGLSAGLTIEMTGRLKKLGLTVQQFAVLMIVLEHEGSNQTDIGKRFRAPPYAISRALDALQEKNLIERRPDPNSRRTHWIFATGDGLELAPQMFALVAQVNEKLMQPLNPEESETLKALLRRILTQQSTRQ